MNDTLPKVKNLVKDVEDLKNQGKSSIEDLQRRLKNLNKYVETEIKAAFNERMVKIEAISQERYQNIKENIKELD